MKRTPEGLSRRNLSAFRLRRCQTLPKLWQAGAHAARGSPDISECAAVGVASEFASDDDVKLVVVPRTGVVLDPVALLTYLVRRLPHYMVPRYIEIIDALPRTPTNKVRKALLRENGVSEKTWDRKAAGVALRPLVG
jgi:crotonobetaine/carnitine-CoA ligase